MFHYLLLFPALRSIKRCSCRLYYTDWYDINIVIIIVLYIGHELKQNITIRMNIAPAYDNNTKDTFRTRRERY